MTERLFVIYIAIVLTSCGHPNNRYDEHLMESQIDTIYLDVKSKFGFRWPETLVVDNVLYLETTDTILISSISKLRINPNNHGMIIFDKRQNAVFDFDSIGRFKQILKKQGGGPTEYRNARDIQVNFESKELYLLDNNGVIKNYSLKDFSFQGIFNSGMNNYDISSFVILNNVVYLWSDNPSPFFVSDPSVNNAEFYHLIRKEGNQISYFIKHQYGAWNWDRFYSSNLKDDYILTPIKGSNLVYGVNEKGIYEKYSFPFNGNGISEDQLKHDMNDLGAYLMNDYFKSLTNFRETQKYLLFDFIGEQGKSYHVLFDKSESKVFSIGQSVDIYSPVIETSENYYYTAVFPVDLIDLKESGVDLENHIIFKNVDFDKITRMDNPVIIKFHI